MGWTFMPVSREELIQRLIAPKDGEELHAETIDHDVQDRMLWSVERLTARQKTSFLAAGQSGNFIVCYLLDTHRDNWGYKALEESMHPFEYSCPLPFLDLAPEQCPAWRRGVRKFHELYSA
ncbi:MAG: hypothetical protein LBT71_11660 [Azoarcus sp.]|jgi:hypothetical protein|nr:hypothetical protein [Azoarcus sp.]